MGTTTIKNQVKCTINANGLGEVKYVNAKPGAFNTGNTVFNNYTYIFFKPYNGVLVTSVKETWNSENSQGDTSSGEKEHYLQGVRDPWLQMNKYYVPFYDNVDDLNPVEMFGYFFIGTTYEEISTSSDEYGEDYSYSSSITYTWEIYGEADHIKLDVIGQQPDNCVYYQWSRNSSETYTVMGLFTEDNVTYTNMVGFEDQYDFDDSVYEGLSLMAKAYHVIEVNPTIKVYNINVTTKDMWDINDVDLPSVQSSFTIKHSILSPTVSSDGIIGVYLTKNENTLKHFLLYCDCFLAIYQSLNEHKKGYCTNKGLGDSIPYELIEDGTNRDFLKDISIPNDKLNLVSDNGILFSSIDNILPFLMDTSQNDTEKLQNDIEKLYYNIPKEHRWVTWLCDQKTSKRIISPACNIVKLIHKSKRVKISSDGVFAESPFVRFTGYWLLENTNGVQVLSESDRFKTDVIANVWCTPIIKPWAAVDMIWHSKYTSQGTSPGPGAWSPKLNRPFSHIHNRLSDNYDTDKKYYTEYIFTTDDEKIDKELEQYAKTISPFKIEFWDVHGGRHPYYGKNYSDDDVSGTNFYHISEKGTSSTAFDVKSIGISDAGMYKLHEQCKKWAIDSGCTDKLKLFFKSAACFGQGIRNCVTGRDVNNYCTSTAYLAPAYCDMFWSFSACSTHIGVGEPVFGISTGDIISETTMDLEDDDVSYSDVVTRCTQKLDDLYTRVYSEIEKFFNRNYDKLGQMCIDKDWNNALVKQDILQSIQNKGSYLFNVTLLDYSNSPDDRSIRSLNISKSFVQFARVFLIKGNLLGDGMGDFKGVLVGVVDSPLVGDSPKEFKADTQMLDRFADDLEDNIDQLTKESRTIVFNKIEEITNRLKAEHVKTEYEKNDYLTSDVYRELINDQEILNLFQSPDDVKTTLECIYITQSAVEIEYDVEVTHDKIVDILKEYTPTVLLLKFPILAASACCCRPIIGYSGAFQNKDAKYLRNPDKEEDEWLASDDDLKKLRELTFVAKKTIKA